MLIQSLRVCALFAWLLCCLGLATAFAQTESQASAPIALPHLIAPLVDATSTLSVQEVQQITDQLQDIEASAGTKIVVLVLPTTAPEAIESFAYRAASTWKLGPKDSGKGLLWVIAKDDQRMRIETSRAVEGALPDLRIARIFDTEVQPHFQQGDFAAGITAGLREIQTHLESELATDARNDTADEPSSEYVADATIPALLWLGLIVFVAYAATHTFGLWWGTALLHGLYTLPLFLLADGVFFGFLSAAIVSICGFIAYAMAQPRSTTVIGTGTGTGMGTASVATQSAADTVLDDWIASSDRSTDSEVNTDSYDTGGGGSYAGGGASGSW